MRSFLYLAAFAFSACLLTCCQVQPPLTPVSAYVGTYSCTLTSQTIQLNGRSQDVETKTYTGRVVQTADRAVQLSLTAPQGDAGLTVPMKLTDQGLVVSQFETISSTAAAGSMVYWSSYYTGNGQLTDNALSVELNAASYRIIGASGNQTQLSASDVDCHCVKQGGASL